MLTESGSEMVSCADAYFTLLDEGVPVDEYGRGICVDNIDDPDVRAVAEHWLASYREETVVIKRSLTEDLERLAATSPDVRRDARLRARFKQLAGCTCTSLDDGRIYLDAGCPVHGREARPENWPPS